MPEASSSPFALSNGFRVLQPGGYLDFWRAHPSFSDPAAWNEDVEAYFRYDLTGEEPERRSRVSLEPVRADATEQLILPEMMSPGEQVTCPVTWIRAERGVLNDMPMFTPRPPPRSSIVFCTCRMFSCAT